ncbi:class III signal peptide-containing protein [Candidatus Micrarchaeota archaeon]|nr:class III signal peptide-containing protein [Candidatus Micrarchaeota archaeon]
MDEKGQGALEYLLLIGGAVLVAVVVIVLIISLADQTADTVNTGVEGGLNKMGEAYTNALT